MKKRRLRAHDLRMLRDCHGLVGVDEAGRGALAGPVVAGAVMINRAFLDSDWCRRHAPLINDSKQLSAAQREFIYERMDWLRREHRIIFAAGTAGVVEIEHENILGATRLAMRRAIESALAVGRISQHPPDPLFTYDNPPSSPRARTGLEGPRRWQAGEEPRFSAQGDCGGDGVAAIAMASIAKVTETGSDALDIEAQLRLQRGTRAATPNTAALLAMGPGAPPEAFVPRS
jgi:ribonuclease HII